ncbi:Hsp70 family protein [Streptomyces alboflavus]|uniref:Hsp70 family protein n=1 Tax=Streptomyces alboflavus TaxID=67267 RepID=UPI0036C0D8F6
MSAQRNGTAQPNTTAQPNGTAQSNGNALTYGIDLGTSNSSIMVGRPDGTVVRVGDPLSGGAAIPTSVCLGPEGQLLVGAAAEYGKRLRPFDYRSEFKRDMGETTPSPLGDRSCTPLELVAEVLRFLCGLAADAVPGRPERVVITVPVTWEAARHEDMLAAAEQAGIARDTVRLETEPEAAVRAALAGAVQGPGTFLVHDLGGGTFDCAVARRFPDGTFTVLGSKGLDDVGGADLTRGVVRLLRERFPEPMAELLEGPAHRGDVLRRRIGLFDMCETVKIRLSVDRVFEDWVTELRPPTELTLAREELEQAVRPLLDRTLDSCEELLGDADLSWADVDEVIPVGGADRMPLVGALLAQRSRRAVHTLEEPELAVVMGAALAARGQLLEEAATRRAEQERKRREKAERQRKEQERAERRRREREERERRERAAAEAAAAVVRDAAADVAASSPAPTSSSSSSSGLPSFEPGQTVVGGCAGFLVGGVGIGLLSAIVGAGDASDGLYVLFGLIGAVVGAIAMGKKS